MKDNRTLVEGASQFYKHWSFWGILVLGVLPLLEQHTDAISSVVPAEYQGYAQMVLAGVVAMLRFVKQSSINK